jgi:5'-3' exonuclease
MTRLLVDSASLWYRAFYGLPESVSSSNNQPNNAIRGFFDGLARIISKYRPDEIAICLDDNWRPAWRVELYPGYKLNRLEIAGEEGSDQEAEPDLLTPQIGPIIELCSLLGLATVSAEDQEADDVIATLAFEKAATPVRVLTGDRDLFQILKFGEDVKIIYLAKGIANHDLVDRQYVEKKYGIPADRYSLFAAIRGDSSDGLPGIRGIGEKGAATIVNKFASMNEILIAAQKESNDLSPLHRKRLLMDIDYANIAEQLVTCRTDLAIQSSDLGLWREKGSIVEFRKRAHEWGMGTAMERIIAALDL